MVAMPILAAPETAAPCWRSRFHALHAGYVYVPYSSLESVIEQSKEG